VKTISIIKKDRRGKREVVFFKAQSTPLPEGNE
jgi:hypothetical protein